MKIRSLCLLLIGTFTISCSGVWDIFKKEEKFPLPLLASSAPVVELPSEINANSLRILERPQSETPALIGKNSVPIGNIHDIYLEFNDKNGNLISTLGKRFHFKKAATFKYKVDRNALRTSGLSEEFGVFYQDHVTKKWVLVPGHVWDAETSTITVTTDHFTPFILTAIPLATPSGIPAPPACISADTVSLDLQGVFDDSSVSQAKFSLIGEGFQYYQDRVYTVKTDVGAFRELGFEGALGIATCQGGAGSCGNAAIHKNFQGNEYISFNAPKNLEVYVLYDTRGGVAPSDTSQDADWLNSDYTLLTGKYVFTTDTGLDPDLVPGASGYKVYKSNRIYLAGERVVLPGNKRGTTAGGIQSTYWVIIKPAGAQGFLSPASSLCSVPPANIPPSVTGLKVFPGSDRILLHWDNPQDPALKNVLIRRSQTLAPASLGAGNAPGGSELTKESYLDTGLAPNTTYYYSVFALNEDGVYNGVASISASTGTDTDGDGLSDLAEVSFDLSQYFQSGASYFSNPNSADTDGDGVSDGDEITAGQDPANPDRIAPNLIVTKKESAIGMQYQNSHVDILLEETATPEVVKYFTQEATQDNPFTAVPTPPHPFSSLWTIQKPTYITSEPDRKVKHFAVWGKDKAGNISPLAGDTFSFTKEVLDPDLVFVRNKSIGDVNILSISPSDGKISIRQKITGNYDSMAFSPKEKDYLFLNRANTAPSTDSLEVWKYNLLSGQYSLLISYPRTSPPSAHKSSIDVSVDGKKLYLLADLGPEAGTTTYIEYNFNSSTGALTETQRKGMGGIKPDQIRVDSSGRELFILAAAGLYRLLIPDLIPEGTSNGRYSDNETYLSSYIQDMKYFGHYEDPVFHIYADSSDPVSGQLRMFRDKGNLRERAKVVDVPTGYRARAVTMAATENDQDFSLNKFLVLTKASMPFENRIVRRTQNTILGEFTLAESDVSWIDVDPGYRFLYAATQAGDFLTYAILQGQTGAPRFVLKDRINITSSFGLSIEAIHKMNRAQVSFIPSYGKIRRLRTLAGQSFFESSGFYASGDQIGFAFIVNSPTWAGCPGITPVQNFTSTARYASGLPFPNDTATTPVSFSYQNGMPIFQFIAPGKPGNTRVNVELTETYPGCITPPLYFGGTQYTTAYDDFKIRTLMRVEVPVQSVDTSWGVTTPYTPYPPQPPAPSDSVGSEYISFEAQFQSYDVRGNFNRAYYVFWAGILFPTGNCFRSGVTEAEGQAQCEAENNWPWHLDSFEIYFNRFYYKGFYTYSLPYTGP